MYVFASLLQKYALDVWTLKATNTLIYNSPVINNPITTMPRWGERECRTEVQPYYPYLINALPIHLVSKQTLLSINT